MYLRSRDFVNGTYRIKKSGTYILAEDIIFSPNDPQITGIPTDDFFPKPGDGYYSDPAYRLGFFTAISIEAPDVVVDLNGHKIEQSKRFYVMQRWWSAIELNNTAFLPKQGPADFGPLTGVGRHVVIRNGYIGRSSHHGIHGNSNHRVTLENLTIENFEVAGIALNGATNVRIRNVKIGGSNVDVPVSGLWSSARFLYLSALANSGNFTGKVQESWQMFLDLYTRTRDKLLNGDPLSLDEYPFANTESIPDGNMYGILFNTTGVAVNDFVEETVQDTDRPSGVSLNHIYIYGLRGSPREVITVSLPDGTGAMTDFSGSVFHLVEATDHTGVFRKSNGYFYFQMAYGELVSGTPQGGRYNFTKDLITWAWSGTPLELPKGYVLKENGDDMFHVSKGIHGIRMDGAMRVSMEDVVIDGVINHGAKAIEMDTDIPMKPHDKQKRPGYCGADATAWSLSACRNISCAGMKIKNIQTTNGITRGIRFLNEGENFDIHHVEIKNLTGGPGGTFAVVEEKYNDDIQKNLGIYKYTVEGLSGPGVKAERIIEVIN